MKKIILSVILGLFLFSTFVSANVIIKSVPFQSIWRSDGTTEYRMDVYLDSTPEPSEMITSADWDVVVPPFLTVTKAELPTVNDFFAGYEMIPGWNRVDSTVEGGELTDNSRSVASMEGPLNREGILGSYWFTVNPNAPAGTLSFNLNDVSLLDINRDRIHGTLIENTPFRIKAPLDKTISVQPISGELQYQTIGFF